MGNAYCTEAENIVSLELELIMSTPTYDPFCIENKTKQNKNKTKQNKTKQTNKKNIQK